MARRRPDDRFHHILEAAAGVFIEQGYRRTQMADVAAAMGVAKGTLYLYVESKEALFDAALRYVDSPDATAAPAALPLPTPRPEDTVAYVRGELARQSELPSLAAALARRQVKDAAGELATILGDLFDVLARNRRRLKLLDRSARDYPEIAALWFDGARGGLLALLQAYLEDRVRRGHFESPGNLAVTARLMLETLVFWAVHRHWDIPPTNDNAHEATDAELKTTVVGLLVRSVVKEKSK